MSLITNNDFRNFLSDVSSVFFRSPILFHGVFKFVAHSRNRAKKELNLSSTSSTQPFSKWILGNKNQHFLIEVERELGTKSIRFLIRERKLSENGIKIDTMNTRSEYDSAFFLISFMNNGATCAVRKRNRFFGNVKFLQRAFNQAKHFAKCWSWIVNLWKCKLKLLFKGTFLSFCSIFVFPTGNA